MALPMVTGGCMWSLEAGTNTILLQEGFPAGDGVGH